MPQIIAKFDPSSATDGTFPLNLLSNGEGNIVVWNESNWALDFALPDGTTEFVPAWTAQLLYLGGPAGQVTWEQDTQLNSGTPPISKVWVVAYGRSEPIPGTYPVALVRQANVGNNTPLSVQASSLSSTADAPGTVEISLQDVNHSSPQFKVTNGGNLTSAGYLDFDNGHLTSNGAGSLTLEEIYFQTTASIDFGAYGLTQLNIYCNGTKVAHIDSSGNLVLKGTLTQNGAP